MQVAAEHDLHAHLLDTSQLFFGARDESISAPVRWSYEGMVQNKAFESVWGCVMEDSCREIELRLMQAPIHDGPSGSGGVQ